MRPEPRGHSTVDGHAAREIEERLELRAVAATMFDGHPHLTIFPGEAVEVMPLLPIPGA